MKKLLLALAVIGVLLTFSAVSTMDYYTKEVIQDFPTHLWWMLYGGMAMTVPAFVYTYIEDNKEGK